MFAAFLVVAMTMGVRAQVPAHIPAVGILSPAGASDSLSAASREALESGLQERGWTAGQNIRLHYRYAEGDHRRLEGLARELVQLRVDVIVARATGSIIAAKRSTAAIPIVMSASGDDPVQTGLITNLARPGGNVTGLTLLNPDLRLKHLQLLKEIIPAISRVAILSGPTMPNEQELAALAAAANDLSLQIRHVHVKHAADFEETFAAFARANIEGLVVWGDPLVLEPNMEKVITLTRKHRIPAIYWLRTYAQRGGLLSYGADLLDVHRRSAYFVDRLLRGARPSELPVEAPTKFALVLNLNTARAIGIRFPPSVLARADEVIE